MGLFERSELQVPQRAFQILMLDLTDVDTDTLLERIASGEHFNMIPLREGQIFRPTDNDRAFTVVITSISAVPNRFEFEVVFKTRENLPRGVRPGRHVVRFHPDHHTSTELPESFFADA